MAVSLDRLVRTKKQTRLSGRVISIGNLTTGGTGKTPWVIKLANDLRRQGHSPAILTRGYQGFLQGSGQSDEVELMIEKCPGVPVGVGADRHFSAQTLKKNFSPDVYILDDGFQHWPLFRDVDIVCLDATDPWGGGFLIPCGRLREPLTALRRAHAILLTRCDLVPKSDLEQIENRIRLLAPRVEIFRTQFSSTLWSVDHHTKRDLLEIKGQRVVALSALGNPLGFERLLEKLGAVVFPKRFRDHHRYSQNDRDSIQAECAKVGGVIVTTEKDWVKLKATEWANSQSRSCPVYILQIESQLLAQDQKRWDSLLKGKPGETSTSL